MRRIRLDIGALTASPENGGSFMFFLYREGMNKCLPVKLSPPDMHAVLSNFNNNSKPEKTIHAVFAETLMGYRIELLEMVVTRDEQKDAFTAELLLFDGEREVRKCCGFIDGVIMAKVCACPIYIDEEMMEKYSTTIDIVSEKIVKKEIHLQKLKEELANAVAAEDYERAAQINKAIGELSKESNE